MQAITFVELEAETVEMLPAKETLFFDTNVAGVWASNTSVALNAATVLSSANSTALQAISVNQG